MRLNKNLWDTIEVEMYHFIIVFLMYFSHFDTYAHLLFKLI